MSNLWWSALKITERWLQSHLSKYNVNLSRFWAQSPMASSNKVVVTSWSSFVVKNRNVNWKKSYRLWTSLRLLGPSGASTLPRVLLSTATFRIWRRRSLWMNSLTSFTPDAFMCERKTSGFQPIHSSWLSIVLSLRQAWELAALRHQWDLTFLFLCVVSNAINSDMAGQMPTIEHCVWSLRQGACWPAPVHSCCLLHQLQRRSSRL